MAEATYKHSWTRRYIHLSESGVGYAYVGDDGYRQLPTLELAFRALPPEDWPGVLASPALDIFD